MKNIILTLTLLISINIDAFTQVGIGNATPNAGSILDLTNTNDKALILPTSTAIPTSVGTFTVSGMMMYFNDKIFLKTSTGVNVLSPWIYSGVPANGIYSEVGLPIGIGIAPLLNSSAILTIADATSEVTVTTSTASVVIGDNDFNATHMLIDKDELLVKTDANTAGTLKLQEANGGTVQVGENLTNQSNLNVFGKIQQNGRDLVPVGSIMLWYGLFDTDYPIVAGVTNTNWHICDGTNGTPNLSNAFVVGIDMSTTGNSAPLTNNGQPMLKTITVGNLPGHQHEAGSNSATMNITASGAHQHTDQETGLADNDDFDGIGYYIGGRGSSYNNDGGDGFILATGSDHTHPNANFTGFTGLGDGLAGTALDITPAASRLAYIMKIN